MSYDDSITRVPDDDPEGDGRDQRDLADACPDCGVWAWEPCEPTCRCVHCRRAEMRRAAQEVA